MSDSTVPGARGLLTFKKVELGWFILNAIFWQLTPMLYSHYGSPMIWFSVVGGIATLVTLAELVVLIPFMQGRRGTDVETLAQGAVVLTGLMFLLDVVGYLPMLGGGFQGGMGVGVLQTLASFGAAACLWLALARGTSTGFTPLFIGLAGGRAVIGLMSLMMRQESYRRLLMGSAGMLLSWLHLGIAAIELLLIIGLLRQVVREGGAEVPNARPSDGIVPPVPASRDILIGALLLIIGVGATLASYSAASGGGRYFVASGAIAWGLVRLIRGLVRLSSS